MSGLREGVPASYDRGDQLVVRNPHQQPLQQHVAHPMYAEQRAVADVGIFFARARDGTGLVVNEIAEDGPAKRYIGAVRPGDSLVAINGQDMAGVGNPEQAHSMLVGKPGTSVNLVLRRNISGTIYNITVVRGGVAVGLFRREQEFNDSYQHNIAVVAGIDTTFRPWRTPYGARQRWGLEYDHPNSPWATALMYGSYKPSKTPVPNLGAIGTLGAPFTTVTHEVHEYQSSARSPPPPPPQPMPMPIAARYHHDRIMHAGYAAAQDVSAGSFRSSSPRNYHHITRIF